MCAKDNYVGEFHLDIDTIYEPDGQYSKIRVRDINKDCVHKLTLRMLKNIPLPYNAPPMVVVALNGGQIR